MAASGGPDSANILQALQVALDVTGTDREKRKAATDFLEQVKSGEVHSVANVAFFLVQASQPLEVRHYAFTLLQHVAHVRWLEVPAAERRPLVSLFLQLLGSSGRPEEPWAIKSRAAALVAEVIRQEGPPLWQEVLPPLGTMAREGPAPAETVAMLLRWLPEDVTVHNEDLDAPARRALLLALMASLGTVLPLLYDLASQHCGAALAALQAGQQQQARPHAAVVTAALAASDAYSDWAPLPALEASRLIEAAGALLQAREFREGAADFLKHVAARRRPTDESLEQHDAALGHVAAALVAAAPEALAVAESRSAGEEDRQFAEKVAEGLAALGTMNGAALAGQGEEAANKYLAQVLAFLSSPVLAVVLPLLPAATSLLRDAGAHRDKPKAKPGPTLQLPPHWCAAVLAAVHKKVRRSNSHGLILGDGVEPQQEEDDEEWPPEFETARDYGNYRSKLSDIMRLVAGLQPRLAVEYACRHVMTATTTAAQAQRPVSKEVLLAVEGSHVVLEAVLAGIPSAALEAAARSGGPAQQDELGLAGLLEAMLHHLLNLQVAAAGLVHLQGRLFEACGPYLAGSPAALPSVLHKLLLMLQRLALPPGAQLSEPILPGRSTPREKAPIWAARLQVCTSVLRVARSAGPGLVPHLEGIAGAIGQMHTAGQLTPSEHGSLAEAILVIATATGPERQAQVLDWLLAPLRQQWIDCAWQQAVSTPAGLASLLLPPLPPSANGPAPEAARGPPSVWWIYHALALFEKALRRAAPQHPAAPPHVRTPRSPSAPLPAPGPSSPPLPHPMGPHLSWILPPLLHLLRAVHHLWLPAIQQSLPPHLQAALRLGPLEVGVLLGSVGRSVADPQQEAPPPEEEQAPRTWLKGVREAGYTVLGTAAARVPGFYQDLQRAAAVGAALTADLAAVEMRHLRLMVKIAVSPLVAHCPPEQWEAWLAPLVPPVLAQAHTTLAAGWAQLTTQTGGAALPPAQGAVEEILHDKMVRDLSRDVCALLALFAPAGPTPPKPVPLSSSPPSVDPGLLGWLLQHPPAAAAGLELATQALTWPDTEAAQKALILAAGAAQVAPLDARLYDLVGRTLLSAVVRALAMESNAPVQADLLALVRDIYVNLAPKTEAVRQVLLSLPHMTLSALAEFEAAVGSTNSIKEQRLAVRHLLQGGAGGQLRALNHQKAGTLVTNLTDRGKQIQERTNAQRSAQSPSEIDKQGGLIGLALLH